MQNTVQLAYNMKLIAKKTIPKEGKQMLQDRYMTKHKNLYIPTFYI
jgi:hypothetical protein